MKVYSENRPSAIEFTDNKETIFNWNIVENNGKFEYDSIVAAGEPNRYNILHALLQQQYDSEEIQELENIKAFSSKKADKEAWNAFKDVRSGYDAVISEALGADFNEYPKPE